MVVASAEDLDAKGVYVDAYVNGVRGTYHITSYKDSKGNTVKFADLSAFKLNTAISEFANQVDGKIYRAVINTEDGTCQVSETFNKSTTRYPADTTKEQTGTWNKAFKLFAAPANTKYEFNDGISDPVNNKKENRIRTNSSTKFYFIDTDDNTISVFTGKTADKFSIDTSAVSVTVGNYEKTYKVEIFADKIGYGEDSTKNGVAKFVVVYYNAATKGHIEGFNLSSITNAIVYVANAGTYTVGSASEFGLTGKSGTYYKYGTVAINMANGEKMAVYTPKVALERGFYEVDGMGIISGNALANDDPRLDYRTIDKDDIDLADQYITITSIFGTSAKVNTLITTKFDKLETVTNKKDHISADGIVVRFLKNDTADGIVVFIVGVKPENQGEDMKVNATWTDDGGRYVAIAEKTATTTKISGSVYVALDKYGNSIRDTYAWNNTVKVAGKWAKLKEVTAGIPARVNIYAADGSTVKYADVNIVKEVKVDADGVCTFSLTLVQKDATPWEDKADQKFATGNYFVRIEFADTMYGNGTFNIPVTVK